MSKNDDLVRRLRERATTLDKLYSHIDADHMRKAADAIERGATPAVEAEAGLSQWHLDNWTDGDFKNHIPAVRAALKAKTDEIERLRWERDEAESALWRIAPNTYTISNDPDLLEGPGETYRDAWFREKKRTEAAEAHVIRLEEMIFTLRKKLGE